MKRLGVAIVVGLLAGFGAARVRVEPEPGQLQVQLEPEQVCEAQPVFNQCAVCVQQAPAGRIYCPAVVTGSNGSVMGTFYCDGGTSYASGGGSAPSASAFGMVFPPDGGNVWIGYVDGGLSPINFNPNMFLDMGSGGFVTAGANFTNNYFGRDHDFMVINGPTYQFGPAYIDGGLNVGPYTNFAALTMGDSAWLASGSAALAGGGAVSPPLWIMNNSRLFVSKSIGSNSISGQIAYYQNQGSYTLMDNDNLQIDALQGQNAAIESFPLTYFYTGVNMISNKVQAQANGTVSADSASWGQVYETVGGYVIPTASPNVATYYLSPAGTTKVVGMRWLVNNDGTNGAGSAITVALVDETASSTVCSGSVNCAGATFGDIACTASLTAAHQFRLGYSGSACAVNPGISISMQLTH